jgi:DNA invertase Pin-like site-specific DNA recombinase
MVKAAVYTRVSTDDQAKEGFSLDAQKDRLAAYCEAQGWDIADYYIDDGHSGRNTKRPEYQRMMLERDRWDLLLVMKMDRIHRNSKNFMTMMEDLEKWGKKFTSMNESLDTSNAVGRFVVDIIQRIAQLESEQIGERTYMGMAQKAESGEGLLGFNPPYGYCIKEGDLAIVEPEAMIVRDVFASYLAGKKMKEIADELNQRDVHTRRGNGWTIYSISRLLRNPAYAGFRRWDGIMVRTSHQAIVEIGIFNDVQKLLLTRIRDQKKRNVKFLDEGSQAIDQRTVLSDK